MPAGRFAPAGERRSRQPALLRGEDKYLDVPPLKSSIRCCSRTTRQGKPGGTAQKVAETGNLCWARHRDAFLVVSAKYSDENDLVSRVGRGVGIAPCGSQHCSLQPVDRRGRSARSAATHPLIESSRNLNRRQ
jgi:hypothetical protein